MSSIDPTREQFDAFKALPRDQPIQMLNLVRLNAQAKYPQGHPNHGKAMSGLPAIASRSIRVLEQLEVMARDGLMLSPDTIAALGRVRARQNRWRTVALWVIAITFVSILWLVR